MRLFLRAAFAAALLSLAGCGGGVGADLITKVQEATVKACGFMPVASTVAAILDATGVTGGAGVMAATAAASICAAVTKPNVNALGDFAAKKEGQVAEVNGVAIRGYFVDLDKMQDE